MVKYIKRGVLHLGESDDEIKSNLEDLISYIYHQCPLNHDAMKELYEDVIVPITFDDRDDDDDDNNYRYKLTFCSNMNIDREYIYEFNEELDTYRFNENIDFISEVFFNICMIMLTLKKVGLDIIVIYIGFFIVGRITSTLGVLSVLIYRLGPLRSKRIVSDPSLNVGHNIYQLFDLLFFNLD